MKLAIDTSVWVSHFGRADEFTEESKLFFAKLVDQKQQLILPTMVLAETVTILVRQRHSDLNKIYQNLMQAECVGLDLEFMQKYIDQIKVLNTQLKTSDLIIAVTAKLAEAVLVTWDKQLLKETKDICEVTTPREFLSKSW